MKKKELKQIIDHLENRLDRLRMERDDAVQKCQAAEMALGEQTGSGPQVDREVRIGGEEEAQEKAKKRLIVDFIDETGGSNSDGNQENTERPDDASGSGFNPQRNWVTDGRDGIYRLRSGLGFNWTEGVERGPIDHEGYWIDTGIVRKELDYAKRQAGLLAGDSERERTD